MKVNLHVRSKTCAVLSCLAILAISTLAAGVANAKGSRDTKVTLTRTVKTRLDSGKDSANLKAPVKSRLNKLTAKRLNRESVKALLKKCGCTLSAEDSSGISWGRCFRGCLADAGVSSYGAIMCGVACATAWTGAGALVCAVCLGVSVTVVEVCALGCLAYPDGYKGGGSHSLILTKNLKPKLSRPGAATQRIKV